jgi:hypothetical protein
VGQSEDPQAIAAYGAFEARVLRAEGKPSEGLAAAERALAVTAQVGLTYWALKVAIVEALEASFALGNATSVGEHLATLNALQPGALTPFLAAQRARFRARLSAADDDFEAAEEQFRALGTPFYLAVTKLEHAESLLDQQRKGEAEPLLAQAREAFERLRAQPWVERSAQPSRSSREVRSRA